MIRFYYFNCILLGYKTLEAQITQYLLENQTLHMVW